MTRKAPMYVKETYKLLKAYTKNDVDTIYSFIYDEHNSIIESWRTMWDVSIILMENSRIKNKTFLDRLYSFNAEIEGLSEDEPKEERLVKKEVKKFASFLEENYRGLV